ncbi:MAG: NAD(P)-dependent oxidoreductase [Gammaproteobacteria bacterium]|nr:NAD(P)-dependent oxidoreductase [Gammaproteobacteria bacterium]MDH5304632.1 NAD(P)-dependent oxidoreductase [Gammaproteobacteria bacterium]
MTQKVAFIGLGVMGYPMAGYLAKAGHEVVVFNRTRSRADAWVSEYGGKAAATPAQAAAEAVAVFACVGNDDDLRSVTTGENGAFHGLKPGSVFIDHTTASATIARELHAAAKTLAVGFLDAPVSGGQAGAEKGALTCMVGGDQETFDRARPLLECYTKMLRLLGPAGAGQLAKMVNQICIAGVVQGLAEALHFAKATGQDGEAVLEVIAKGAAQSWQMENRGKTMLRGEFDFGFAVDWMRKDLAIILNQARKANAHLPITALIDQFYAEVQNLGGRRWDTSSLIAPLERIRGGGN